MRRGKIDEAMKRQGYLTIKEAAVRAGLSESTLRSAAKTGQLIILKIGARVFTSMPSVVKFIGEPGARAMGLMGSTPGKSA